MASSSANTASALARSPYDRVEVLMLRWVDHDDHLMLDQEMTLQSTFESYGYGVTWFGVDGYGDPAGQNASDSRVVDVVMKWIEKFDVGSAQPKKTLLIITYSGHADPREVVPGQGRRLFAQSHDALREEFDMSWMQLQCRQRVQHSDLWWLSDCCYASVKGFGDQYQFGSPSMQMEMCGAGNGKCSIVEDGTSFFERIARNLKEQEGALTVQERFRTVHSPGARAGEGVYRLDVGTPANSIIIAPKRKRSGKIVVRKAWPIEAVLPLNEHTCQPEGGITWTMWTLTPPSPTARVDRERLTIQH